jgi:hypothetical protein
MEYLVDVHWTDPVATAMAAVLSALPEGVEPTTASVPTGHGFIVLRADDVAAFERATAAMMATGADVRVVARRAA